jgi:hypothetical protein
VRARYRRASVRVAVRVAVCGADVARRSNNRRDRSIGGGVAGGARGTRDWWFFGVQCVFFRALYGRCAPSTTTRDRAGKRHIARARRTPLETDES